MDLNQEFVRQVANLLQKGYPQAAGIGENEFLNHIDPLAEKLKTIKSFNVDINEGKIPFVVVVKNSLVPTAKAITLIEKDKKMGVEKLFPLGPDDFNVIEKVVIPVGEAYLLINVDRGKENRNVAPHYALKLIEQQKRSPLNIDEGIAIVTQYPEFLIKNNCFSLLASRHLEDKKVPAIWINSQKQPNLGWCWDGNPHTWLGSASCSLRIGL